MTNRPHSIVVATDFSPPANAAVERAIDLARHFDAELHIAHVFTLPIPLITAYEFSVPEHDVRYARGVAHKKLDAWAEKASVDGVEARTQLLEGPTDKAVDEFARDVGADWIVVGTHGHTGLKHVLLGSVAELIVRHAPCSVLVVRDGLGGCEL